jgi:hypothetical protein
MESPFKNKILSNRNFEFSKNKKNLNYDSEPEDNEEDQFES